MLVRALIGIAVFVTGLAGIGCGDDDPSSTITLDAEADFEPLRGATAYSGTITPGGRFRLEVPDVWNERLVVYLHGAQFDEPRPEFPPIHRHIIQSGYALLLPAYSIARIEPSVALTEAVDLTAAITPRLIAEPEMTVVFGASAGGQAAVLAAEQRDTPFDGALAECGPAGDRALEADGLNAFVGAMYAAGLTESDIAPGTDYVDFAIQRVIPALDDPQRLDIARRSWALLTGGDRPLAAEGFARAWQPQVVFGASLIRAGDVGNENIDYSTIGLPDAFDERVLRVEASIDLGTDNEVNGKLEIPVLTVHATGEMVVPLSHARIIAQKAAAAGREDRLVQRTIQDPDHCGIADAELERAFDDLVEWIAEPAKRPQGESLNQASYPDDVGAEFTIIPRAGSPAAEQMEFAARRLRVRGTAEFPNDIEPKNLLFGVQRDANSLITFCDYDSWTNRAGYFEAVLASAGEAPGCGVPGSIVSAWISTPDGLRMLSPAFAWPEESTIYVALSALDLSAPNDFIGGEIVRAGRRVTGEVTMRTNDGVCATGHVLPVGSSAGFIVISEGCPSAATFEVDGIPVEAVREANSRFVRLIAD